MRYRITALAAAVLLMVSASPAVAQDAVDAGVSPPANGDTEGPTPGAPEPAPSDDRHTVGEALWVSGVAVLVPVWALTGAAATTLVVVANQRTTTIVESWIPVVGPWIMLGDSAGFDTIQLVMTAVSGVLQALSTAAIIAGLVLVNEGPENGAATAALRLLPFASDTAGGLTLAGFW